MKLFRLLDKLFAFLVIAPPLYIIYRYVKWSLKQDREPDEA
jgi:hypothetical protein